MQPFAIVLAAGTSSRFGATKQLQPWRGEPLVRHAVKLAEHACGERSLLVTGHEWQAIVAACHPLAGFIALNERYREGIGASIRTGVRLVAHVADAVLLLLADQPLVTPAHLERLLLRWRRSPTAIVASSYREVAGPPIVFPRQDFPRLTALEGDTGARGLVAAAPDRVIAVEFAAAAVDIDRPEDLAGIDAADS